MAQRRVVVTGAGGFIGRWSIPPLIAAGYEVHAVLSRRGSRDMPAQLRGAEIHEADLLDPAAIESLMSRVEPSHLLHFAWIATPGVYWDSPDNGRWLAAGEILLKNFQAHGGRRAVMAGTCAEYDWARGGLFNEFESALAGADRETVDTASNAAVTPYAQCKLAMQRWLADFGRARDVSTAWGRIFFQYGPDEHPRRLVASVILNLLQEREAPCSHGRQVRSFLHVADVGAAFAALLDSGVQGPVNVGSGEAVTIGELLQRIARSIGRPDLMRYGARLAPPSEPAVLLPDVSRLVREVGWSPRFGLDDGIADTVSWWRARLSRPDSRT
jgi:nucleoside-diphosphate-sugar epimerase